MAIKVDFNDEIDFRAMMDSLDISLYWKDLKGVYRGCNKYAAKMANLKSPDDIIGMTDIELFGEEMAKELRKNDQLVIKNKKTVTTEEQVISPTGKLLTQLSIKKPLYNKKNKLVGVSGNTIDITSRKHAEQLKLENAKKDLIIKRQKKLGQEFDNIVSAVNKAKFNLLDDELDDDNGNVEQIKIELTERENQILYILSLGKSRKDVADILGKVDGKYVSPKTVASIINKKLYVKFDTHDEATLIKKAIKLDYIHMPDSLMGVLVGQRLKKSK